MFGDKQKIGEDNSNLSLQLFNGLLFAFVSLCQSHLVSILVKFQFSCWFFNYVAIRATRLNQPVPDDWCRLISQNHIMPALFDHDFGGKREDLKKNIRNISSSLGSVSFHHFISG